MQISLILRPPSELRIPFNYNHQLQSAIYAKLREVGCSDFWHDDGFASVNRYKGFVFGSLNGRHYTKDKHFHFTDDIAFEVRSPAFEFCDSLQRSVERNSSIKLFDTDLQIVGAALRNRHFSDGTAEFLTNSPVTAYRTEPDGKTTFFVPGTDDFSEYLLMNYRNKFEALFDKPADDVEIKAVLPMKKVVTNFKGTWINGYKGRFILRGASRALEFIYNAGLGAKSSQGFGLLDAVGD